MVGREAYREVYTPGYTHPGRQEGIYTRVHPPREAGRHIYRVIPVIPGFLAVFPVIPVIPVIPGFPGSLLVLSLFLLVFGGFLPENHLNG